MSGDILALIPAGLAFLLQIAGFYLYNERDYKADIEKLEKANKSAEAAAIEGLLESQIATISYEGGDNSGLRDRYLEFVYKLHKHTKIDVELAGFKRVYTKTGSVAMVIFILSAITIVGFAVALLIFKPVFEWVTIAVLCWGLVLLAINIACIVIQRAYIGKLDKMKERGDLVV